MLAAIKRESTLGRPIVIFGAGEIGGKVIEILQDNNITIYCVCDNDVNKQDTLFCGYRVLPAETIQTLNPAVIIATMYFKEIAAQLKTMGIDSFFIYKELFLTWHEQYEKLVFPKCSDPLVSIVMTAFNEWRYTYECLKSVLSAKTDIEYEVIVGDDVSSDETKEIEKYVENIKVIHNKENLGYLKNCNETAKSAKGKYMVMLATDVKVISDYWLDRWIETFERDNTIGAIGAVCLDWDMATMHYGESIDENVTYLENSADMQRNCDVDYVCPACVGIRLDVWRAIGGYDERFIPAWYEDLDFYCEMRRRSYRLVLDTDVRYVHYGNVSYGVVPSKNNICHINRQKFLDKWRDDWQYVSAV